MTDVRPTRPETAPGGVISEAELTALALAADPDAPPDPDAQPWTAFGGDGLLPEWYMPVPMAGRRGWGPRGIAALVILGFLVINACGLCITYGHLVVA